MEKPATRADVFAALAQKSGFEVVEEKESPKQLRIIGRCATERWPFYLPVIHRLLTVSDAGTHGWTCDISKKYILHGDRVAFGWRLIFQAPEDLAQHYGDIAATIRSAANPARVELTSVLLPGYKQGQVRGGVNEKGKGVQSAGALPMVMTRGRTP